MRRFAVLGLLAVLSAGCGNAYLVRPVTVQDEFEETVLDETDGTWVWDKVLLLDVEGLLVSGELPTLFGTMERPLSDLKEKLTLAEQDDRIRAVVVRINSPGGTVTASDVFYHELKAFRERTGRPVVALMMDTAASGGYYVACAADHIVAHPTSLTGSIGVIFQWLNVKGAMEWIQLRVVTIKSGPKKDIASPFREMTPEERELLQGIIDAYHEQFVRVVAASRRDLPIEQVRELADGRVFEARRAHEAGLVDSIGYMDDAVDRAKALAGIEKAKVVTYARSYPGKNSVYAASPDRPAQVNLLNLDLGSLNRLQQARFLYLWVPGR